MIKAEIIGRLGFDAQVKGAEGFEKKYIAMSVAHTEYGRDERGERIETTVWVNVRWHSDGGKLLEHLKKGASVFIRGRQRISVYQDKSGNWVAGINITASEVEITAFAKQENAPAQTQERTANIFPERKEQPSAEAVVNNFEMQSDDLPF